MTRNAFGRPEKLGSRDRTFRVFLTNFGWHLRNGETYQSIDAALFNAKQAGFDAQIEDAATRQTVATWSVIGGEKRN
jgi:hypothetical protein